MNLFVLDPNGNLFMGIAFLKRRLQKMFGFVTGVRSGQFEITFFCFFSFSVLKQKSISLKPRVPTEEMETAVTG